MDLQRSPLVKRSSSRKASVQKGKSPTADIRQQLQETSLNGVQGFNMGPQKCVTRKDRNK